MKDLTFNEWQANLSKQLEKDYKKLNLIKNEKLPTIRSRKPRNIRSV